jgi:Cu-Zn family superoxide dismutase
MKKTVGSMALAVMLALLVACSGGEQPAEEADADHGHDSGETSAPLMRRVNVILEGKSDSMLTGIAMFVQDSSGVTLQLNVENTPPGEHAVHLHETGDCSAADGTSAGGHWNPSMEDHGKWGEPPHHLGDVGNIVVGEDGMGAITLTTDRWSIGTGAENDILGRSIIVHADKDDFTSQPTGAAGGRIGCGVIEG